MLDIDFKKLSEDLKYENSALSYESACILTEYFLPFEITPNPAQNILCAFFNHQDDTEIWLRQQIIEDKEMEKISRRKYNKIFKQQKEEVTQTMKEVFSDCVQRQRYLLLYALDEFMPRMDANETVMKNFQDFVEVSELTEYEAKEVLLRIENVAEKGNILPPDLENALTKQKKYDLN